MLYISKGILTKEQDGRCNVFRHGTEITLTGTESALWKAGQNRPCETNDILTIEDMEYTGLVSIAKNDTSDGIYDLLFDCMFIPYWRPVSEQPLTSSESLLYTWLRDAAIRLTVAEMVYLCENEILPSKDLLGEDGRQELVSRIYLNNDINECTLETKMKSAESRNWVVSDLLSLARKNYVYIG